MLALSASPGHRLCSLPPFKLHHCAFTPTASARLPQGKLPYSAHGQLFSVRPVVYECCPSWECPDGDACPYVRSE